MKRILFAAAAAALLSPLALAPPALANPGDEWRKQFEIRAECDEKLAKADSGLLLMAFLTLNGWSEAEILHLRPDWPGFQRVAGYPARFGDASLGGDEARRLLARELRPEEREIVLGVLADLRQHYAGAEEDAKALMEVGESEVAAEAPVAEAWLFSDFTAESSDATIRYTVDWDPKTIRWYVDGVQVWQRDRASTPWFDEVFHKAYHLRLNFQVGGWLGNPDASTVLPAEFQVDWVRVYQRVS